MDCNSLHDTLDRASHTTKYDAGRGYYELHCRCVLCCNTVPTQPTEAVELVVVVAVSRCPFMVMMMQWRFDIVVAFCGCGVVI